MFRPGTWMLVPLLLAASLGRAQQGGDLQAQILYGFHTEDTNQLTSLVQNLTTQVQSDGTDASLRYHLAHAQYRLGSLIAPSQGSAAESAFGDCIAELKVIIDRDAHATEALALQSACYSHLAPLKRLQAVILRARAADRLSTASQLAPRNPRVVFLMAADEFARAKPGSAENLHAFGELQRAAALFEQSPSTGDDAPGWGHAECYLALGRELQARGDVLDARNWIERALIVAPDYKAAQRRLAQLTGR
jgi:tetratricopeptide (TPR) repeat protein